MTAVTRPRKSDIIYKSLGANEQAIIDKVAIPWLRRLLIHAVAQKMKLQFTGWLQYLMLVPATLGLFIFVGLLYLLGLNTLANVLLVLPLLLLTIIVFDVITSRFHIRFPEALPKPRTEDVFTLIKQRRSCRSYQIRKLTSEHAQGLAQSVSTHLNAPRLGNVPIRLEWVEAPITVWPVVNARHFLVAIAPAEYDRSAILDIGRSLQKIVIDATKMGLGTCWIGPGADHVSVKSHLGDRFNADKDAIICLCAVGYPSGYIPLFIRIFNAQFHKRLPLSALFFADTEMSQPLDMKIQPWSDFAACFESCQWAPSSYNGQTTRCVAKQMPEGFQVDFYAVTSSRYYAAVAIGIWCGNWEMGIDALEMKGHFIQQTELNGKSDHGHEKLPHYDISWVSDIS
ncbi:nitroreductase family protein [Shewanella glacialimarina]|jgi:nitroreductase|uniref:nitroreductase family protein n=1 Tax=Shewanella glacialimarina TaxID=2590884 RepID=UPI001CF85B80|nr:nitroreductase family protein [Shewanella glacialimarina]UCX03192.1 nitroreductase [Shewanella glacialimarina]